ncbi:Alpha-(1,6)-fucosyltransferase [Lamellibrachia satsuma]|nr:Alpha-(1,6)-fucosyltransferase [Lamellibrachia satsuma]
MTKGTWHVMTGLLLFWLLILVYMSTSLFQSGDSPEHMEQQLLKALHELEKLRRQNAELQGLSRELKELRESIEKDNPAVDVLKQKLDVANRKLKRMALLKARADKAESERAANVPALHTKDNPQGDTVANLPSLAFEQLRRQVENGVVEFWFYLRSQLNILQKNNPEVVTDTKKILQNGDDHQWTILKDLVNLTSLSGPAGWQEREAAELSQIVQKRLRYLQVNQ